MTPEMLAALAATNPILAAAIAPVAFFAVCLTMGIAQGIEDGKTKAASKAKATTTPSPVARPAELRKATNTIKQTAQHVKQISKTTEKQQTTIAITNDRLQHSTHRINQTSSDIQTISRTIEHQTEVTQNHLNEVMRLRSSLASTNAALKASQQALATREVELSRMIAELRATSLSLQNNTIAHHSTASELLNRSVRTQAALQSNIAPLIAAKEAEITLLRRENEGLRVTARTVITELNALPNTDSRSVCAAPQAQMSAQQTSAALSPRAPNRAQASTPQASHSSARTLQASGVFSSGTQPLSRPGSQVIQAPVSHAIAPNQSNTGSHHASRPR